MSDRVQVRQLIVCEGLCALACKTCYKICFEKGYSQSNSHFNPREELASTGTHSNILTCDRRESKTLSELENECGLVEIIDQIMSNPDAL